MTTIRSKDIKEMVKNGTLNKAEAEHFEGKTFYDLAVYHTKLTTGELERMQ